METINDILKEIRAADGVDSSGWFTRKHVLDWADRIEAAFKREISSFGALLDENAELKKCIKGACERLDLGAEPCTDCPYAEIDWLKDENAKLKDENAKLRAALKPVLDIVMDDATSDLAMAESIDEAHRIYNEGESK